MHYLSSEEAADDDERAASAHMACRSCGSLWGHERLPAACEAGRWQARGDGRWAGHWMDEGDARPILRDGNGVARPWPIAVAMSIWGGYSLSASWADMVEAHLRSRGGLAHPDANRAASHRHGAEHAPLSAKLALEFAILTAARSGEVRGAFSRPDTPTRRGDAAPRARSAEIRAHRV